MQSDNNLAYIDWKAWDPNKFGFASAKERATFSIELNAAGVKLDSDSHVLEIGFGNGAFAGWAIEKTKHYVGIESNLELVARALNAGLEAYPTTLNLSDLTKNRHFDLIAIFDVLEHLHLEDIIKTLDSTRSCLTRDGKIIIRVPSGDSPFAGHLMHGDITHKTALGRYAFHQLAGLSGLEVVSIHDAAFPILGLGISSLFKRSAVFLARKTFNTLIRAIYYASENAVISPTLVAVLRLKRELGSTTTQHIEQT